jgi:hypothetical protein
MFLEMTALITAGTASSFGAALTSQAHLLHHVGGSRSFPTGCNFEIGLVTRFLSA